MKKAFTATEKYYTDSIVELLALRVASDFKDKMKEGLIAVEDIQDSVEKVLEETGYTDVAKAYILYRKQREKIRSLGATTLDYKDVVDNYVKVEDWHVKENSTVTYSVGGLILNNSGAVTANYWLSEIYDKEIAEAYHRGDIHIHDLSMLTGYSCGWSLKKSFCWTDLVGLPERLQPLRQNIWLLFAIRWLIFSELCKMNGLLPSPFHPLIHTWRPLSGLMVFPMTRLKNAWRLLCLESIRQAAGELRHRFPIFLWI